MISLYLLLVVTHVAAALGVVAAVSWYRKRRFWQIFNRVKSFAGRGETYRSSPLLILQEQKYKADIEAMFDLTMQVQSWRIERAYRALEPRLNEAPRTTWTGPG